MGISMIEYSLHYIFIIMSHYAYHPSKIEIKIIYVVIIGKNFLKNIFPHLYFNALFLDHISSKQQGGI